MYTVKLAGVSSCCLTIKGRRSEVISFQSQGEKTEEDGYLGREGVRGVLVVFMIGKSQEKRRAAGGSHDRQGCCYR